nr:succinate:cytochrome c oxidoreductase subunit 4 [Cyanidioschyzonaceae sp. 2 FvB-2021]
MLKNLNFFVSVSLLIFTVLFFLSKNILMCYLIFVTILMHVQLNKDEILVDYLHQPNLFIFSKYLLKILMIYNFLLFFLLF